MQSFRQICASGIAETLTLPSSSAPSTLDLKKARRLALRKQNSSACNECRRVKRKCGDVRPCGRCLSLGISKSCDIVEAKNVLRYVERPLKYSVTTLHFGHSLPFPSEQLKYHWSSAIIRPFWEGGFKYSSFVEIYNSVPSSMSSSIVNLLGAVARILQSRANQCGTSFIFHFSDIFLTY